jgi:hypothetical protein
LEIVWKLPAWAAAADREIGAIENLSHLLNLIIQKMRATLRTWLFVNPKCLMGEQTFTKMKM